MSSHAFAPLLRAAAPGALAMLLGAAQAVSVASPWNGQPVWWLQMLSLSGLVWLLGRSGSAMRGAGLAGLFATSWLCGAVWWLYISMHVYGGLAAPLAALAVWALCGFLALYYAAAAYVYLRIRMQGAGRHAGGGLVFAALWLLAELARDTWLTGFPWGSGGYAHVNGPLAGYASWIGVYGIGFLAAWLAAMMAHTGSCGRLRWVLAVGVVALPSVAQMDTPWPERFTRAHGQAQVALVQGNIAQGEKFDPNTGVRESLAWYREQLGANTAQLMITPETAIPLLPRHLPAGYWEAIEHRYASGGQAALVGMPLNSAGTGYTNSVMGLKPDQPGPYRYDKHHLVPFGEFIPPLFKWFMQMMHMPLGDFSRGALSQAHFEWAGQRWAPNVCYEDLFGDELARRFKDAAATPTVMANVSNIAWFGNTVAIDQHLHISRMRAMELGRPMVRATNTGATVIINHVGQVTHSLPRHTRGVLTGQVQGREGLTPFAWWAAQWGLRPLWLLGLGVVLAAMLGARGRLIANGK